VDGTFGITDEILVFGAGLFNFNKDNNSDEVFTSAEGGVRLKFAKASIDLGYLFTNDSANKENYRSVHSYYRFANRTLVQGGAEGGFFITVRSSF
jgi:hypothetical protein